MRAVPILVLAVLTSACLIPRSSGAGGTTTSSSGGYAGNDGTAGTSGSSGSYGNDGASGYAGATPAAANTGPQTVSVTIRSSCSKTVPVFYGDKPRYSSGTTSSVSSNSVSSQTFTVGDQMWVLDDSGDGVGNVTISQNTREIEINSSCGGLSAR